MKTPSPWSYVLFGLFAVLLTAVGMTGGMSGCGGGGGDKTTLYIDSDADGYGSDASGATTVKLASKYAIPDSSGNITLTSSGVPYVNNNSDCDDSDENINPAMADTADDDTDQNCDGEDVEASGNSVGGGGTAEGEESETAEETVVEEDVAISLSAELDETSGTTGTGTSTGTGETSVGSTDTGSTDTGPTEEGGETDTGDSDDDSAGSTLDLGDLPDIDTTLPEWSLNIDQLLPLDTTTDSNIFEPMTDLFTYVDPTDHCIVCDATDDAATGITDELTYLLDEVIERTDLMEKIDETTDEAVTPRVIDEGILRGLDIDTAVSGLNSITAGMLKNELKDNLSTKPDAPTEEITQITDLFVSADQSIKNLVDKVNSTSTTDSGAVLNADFKSGVTQVGTILAQAKDLLDSAVTGGTTDSIVKSGTFTDLVAETTKGLDKLKGITAIQGLDSPTVTGSAKNLNINLRKLSAEATSDIDQLADAVTDLSYSDTANAVADAKTLVSQLESTINTLSGSESLKGTIKNASLTKFTDRVNKFKNITSGTDVSATNLIKVASGVVDAATDIKSDVLVSQIKSMTTKVESGGLAGTELAQARLNLQALKNSAVKNVEASVTATLVASMNPDVAKMTVSDAKALQSAVTALNTIVEKKAVSDTLVADAAVSANGLTSARVEALNTLKTEAESVAETSALESGAALTADTLVQSLSGATKDLSSIASFTTADLSVQSTLASALVNTAVSSRTGLMGR